jgi:hypothetical protein
LGVPARKLPIVEPLSDPRLECGSTVRTPELQKAEIFFDRNEFVVVEAQTDVPEVGKAPENTTK